MDFDDCLHPNRLWEFRPMRFILNAVALAGIIFFSGSSAADPELGEGSQRWVPSFALKSGLLMSSASGEVASTGRPSASGTEDLISPWIGGSLELMTPAWESLGGRTRFFVHGGLSGNVGLERDLAKEGAPGEFKVPTIPQFGSPDLVRGQGSVTSVKPTGFQASAGIGLSFTIDTDWRPIRIKPSLEYLVEEVEVSGVVHRATSLDPSIPTFNLYAVSGAERRFFHSLGPGLEVEADIFRKGPMLLALMGSGGAYRLLGDSDVEFSSTDPTGVESATWGYTKDPWTYRFDVGVRFRWVPDGD